jgi:hypothetical protein
MPTIFYSWQSDRGETRSFVRKALEQAIKQLNSSAPLVARLDVEDAERDEWRLDHDTRGAAGTPAIVDTILEKIAACDVFVPDMTFVAGGSNGERLCPNPNVTLEYGYALKAIGPERIVGVMNVHYGPEAELPFDIRHRRFPITYDLSPDASPNTRSEARQRLANELKGALRIILSLGPRPPAALHAQQPFDRGSDFDGGAGFVPPDHPFRVHAKDFDRTFRFPTGPKLFLRLMPPHAVSNISPQAALDCVVKGDLAALGGPFYPKASERKAGIDTWGACSIIPHHDDAELVGAISQIRRSREIWGIETQFLLDHYTRPMSGFDFMTIPIKILKTVFPDAVQRYVRVAMEQLQLSPPFTVILGVANVGGFRVAHGPGALSGPLATDAVIKELTLEDPTIPASAYVEPFLRALAAAPQLLQLAEEERARERLIELRKRL